MSALMFLHGVTVLFGDKIKELNSFRAVCRAALDFRVSGVRWTRFGDFIRISIGSPRFGCSAGQKCSCHVQSLICVSSPG